MCLDSGLFFILNSYTIVDKYFLLHQSLSFYMFQLPYIHKNQLPGDFIHLYFPLRSIQNSITVFLYLLTAYSFQQSLHIQPIKLYPLSSHIKSPSNHIFSIIAWRWLFLKLPLNLIVTVISYVKSIIFLSLPLSSWTKFHQFSYILLEWIRQL